MKKNNLSELIEINIFIENILEEVDSDPDLDLRKITDDLREMTKFILSNEDWVNDSCLKDSQYSTLSFDIVFCDNEKIHQINKEYRNIDRPTDVISFAIFADSAPDERFIFDSEINLGEIILSLEKTKTQAKENGKTFEYELYFLLAHGILHLMGYDHQNEETLERMWDIQKECLKRSLGSCKLD